MGGLPLADLPKSACAFSITGRSRPDALWQLLYLFPILELFKKILLTFGMIFHFENIAKKMAIVMAITMTARHPKQLRIFCAGSKNFPVVPDVVCTSIGPFFSSVCCCIYPQ